MNESISYINHNKNSFSAEFNKPDFSYVSTTARIAIYDDLKSAPRIIEIPPNETTVYIEKLTSNIYEHAQKKGGSIPYTVIREVSENFIHARFKEIVVSILDSGNTIRFADQGPGITNKEKAQLPGFSSAIEPMKHYIRGVGSGFPIVKEYLNISQGSITIEDNLETGAVITISMVNNYSHPSNSYSSVQNQTKKPRTRTIIPPLSQRERSFLPFLLSEGSLGVTDLSHLTNTPMSSTHLTLQKLEQAGLVKKIGQKRMLTDYGFEVAQTI